MLQNAEDIYNLWFISVYVLNEYFGGCLHNIYKVENGKVKKKIRKKEKTADNKRKNISAFRVQTKWAQSVALSPTCLLWGDLRVQTALCHLHRLKHFIISESPSELNLLIFYFFHSLSFSLIQNDNLDHLIHLRFIRKKKKERNYYYSHRLCPC